MAYIYVITNDINKKQYVGKTTETIEKRYKRHCLDSKIKDYALYRAMNKYGIDNFHIELLEQCSIDIINDREKYWIQKLNTYNNGYNETLGGEGRIKYNYDEIVKLYKKYNSMQKVADIFGCNIQTVSKICKEQHIQIKSGSEMAKLNLSKPVQMLDKNTNQVLKQFNSAMEAGC